MNFFNFVVFIVIIQIYQSVSAPILLTVSNRAVREEVKTIKSVNSQKINITEKYDLWRNDKTKLRGANIWQKLKDNQIEPIYTAPDFVDLAAWRANYVNLSHPGVFSEKTIRGTDKNDRVKKYRLHANVMSNLQQMVQFAGDAGLFTVVAFRTGPERNEKIFVEKNPSPSKMWQNPLAQDAWVEMWRETAAALKDSKTVVGYDLMVEPDSATPEQWNALVARIVLAIRSVDSKTPILVEPPNGGLIAGLANLNLNQIDPKNELKIVYAVHNYEPTDYTQQMEGKYTFKCNDSRDEEKGIPKPENYVAFGNEQKKLLIEEYEKLAVWQRTHGNVPMVVNEFGVVRWAGSWQNKIFYPDADKFMVGQINQIENLGMSYAIWKWDQKECAGDDDYNFRNGQTFTSHKDTESELGNKIKETWRRNEISLINL